MMLRNVSDHLPTDTAPCHVAQLGTPTAAWGQSYVCIAVLFLLGNLPAFSADVSEHTLRSIFISVERRSDTHDWSGGV